MEEDRRSRDLSHLYEKVARVPLQIEGDMEHREVTLASGRGEVPIHHVDQIELV